MYVKIWWSECISLFLSLKIKKSIYLVRVEKSKGVQVWFRLSSPLPSPDVIHHCIPVVITTVYSGSPPLLDSTQAQDQILFCAAPDYCLSKLTSSFSRLPHMIIICFINDFAHRGSHIAFDACRTRSRLEHIKKKKQNKESIPSICILSLKGMLFLCYSLRLKAYSQIYNFVFHEFSNSDIYLVKSGSHDSTIVPKCQDAPNDIRTSVQKAQKYQDLNMTPKWRKLRTSISSGLAFSRQDFSQCFIVRVNTFILTSRL